jgi:hypothetical protein
MTTATLPIPAILFADDSGDWIYDATQYFDLGQDTYQITRGRQDEFEAITPGTCQLTLDNTDGRFSYGKTPSVVNLLTNNTGNGNSLTGHTAGTNTNAISIGYAGVTTSFGFRYFLTSAVAAGTSKIIRDRVPVTPLVTYTAQAELNMIATRNTFVNIAWYTSADVPISTSSGTATSTPAGVWTTRSVTAAAPATAAWARVEVGGNGLSIAEQWRYSRTMIAARNAVGAWVDAPFPIDIGTRIRVALMHNGAPYDRFTGVINTWPVEWPNGGKSSRVRISATDYAERLARYTMDSTVNQAILSNFNTVALYPLTEGEEATEYGDISGNGHPSLQRKQRGVGGTATAGIAQNEFITGDAGTRIEFARASAANGKYLEADFPTALFHSDWPTGPTVIVGCFMETDTTVINQVLWRLEDRSSGAGINVGVNSSGDAFWEYTYGTTVRVNIPGGFVQSTIGSPNNAILLTLAITPDATPGLWNFQIYDANASTVSFTTDVPNFDFDTLYVGGGPAQNMANIKIDHVFIATGWTKTSIEDSLLDTFLAIVTGFDTDTAGGRIGRYATWGGITNFTPDADDTPITTQQTDGITIDAAIANVAETVNGIAYFDGFGALVFKARSARYDPPVSLTIDAHGIAAETQVVLDSQQLVNFVKVDRTNGATKTVANQESITKYGRYDKTLTILATTDDTMYQIASWIIAIKSTPYPRISTLDIDLGTATTATVTSALGLELSSLVQVTGLPTQTPVGTSMKLFIEGHVETFSYLTGWHIAFNTTPQFYNAWKLEDPTYGAIDSTNRIVF